MHHRQRIAFNYILDYSRVIPTQFPHEKHICYLKIEPTSINIEKIALTKKYNAPAWGLVKHSLFTPAACTTGIK